MRRVPIIKRLYPSIRKRWSAWRWPNGYHLTHTNQATFLVNWRNYVDRQIAFYNGYETQQIKYLLAAMEKSRCDLFLDIGANIGLYSVLVGCAGAATRLIAFDADPRSIHQLRANLFINGLNNRVEVVEKAVSDLTGIVPFEFYPDSSTGQSRVTPTGTGRVEAICIDDYLQERDKTIFVKIDIEGHEMAAIDGMKATIRANRVYLQVESWDGEALATTLALYGLRPVHRIDDDWYFANFLLPPIGHHRS